jgi:hypothetical protein
MTLVTAQMSVSLDGCYAGPRDDADGDWLAGREAAGFFRVTRWVIDAMAWRERQGFAGGDADTNSGIVAETFAAAGAYVMGLRMTDGPAGAVAQAREAAGDKDVAIAGGGSLVRQALAAGLVDQLELHVSPVVLGGGCDCSTPARASAARRASNSPRCGSSPRRRSRTCATGSRGAHPCCWTTAAAVGRHRRPSADPGRGLFRSPAHPASFGGPGLGVVRVRADF